MKSTITILIEAAVVGLLLIFIYEFTKTYVSVNIKIDNVKPEIVTLFISGFLFHIMCQVSGINTWYVKNYYI